MSRQTPGDTVCPLYLLLKIFDTACTTVLSFAQGCEASFEASELRRIVSKIDRKGASFSIALFDNDAFVHGDVLFILSHFWIAFRS